MKTRMIVLLLIFGMYGTSVEGISVAGVKPSNSVHGTSISDQSASFSMPVQYSMAAPAVASAQLAAASLTSIAPSYNIISTTQHPGFPQSQSGWTPKPFVQHLQPVRDIYASQVPIPGQHNRRVSFSAAYSASEPQFESYNNYEPQYYHKSPPRPTYNHLQSTKIREPYPPIYQSQISYTPPPRYQQYHQPITQFKPNLPNHLSHYNPNVHDFLDFPIHSHKGGNSNSYYKFMFPLALLGISIPALGLMYTYLSRRRRRDLRNYMRPTVDDLQSYLDILETGIRKFQESMDNEPIMTKSS